MDATTETGLGPHRGDSEGLLAGRPSGGVFAVLQGEVSPRSVLAPAGCQLAAAAVSLGSAASAQPETELLCTGTAGFPGRMPSLGLPCRVYHRAVTHPWKNYGNESVRERSVRRRLQNPCKNLVTGANQVSVCVRVCVSMCIYRRSPQWWYLFFNLFKIFSTIWTISLPVSELLGHRSVCEKPVSFSVSVPFASAFPFSIFFCSFIAFRDFCSLQRAAFTWWKGNSVVSMLANRCSPAASCTTVGCHLKALGKYLSRFLRPRLRGFCFPETKRLFPTCDFFFSIPQVP